MDLPLCIGSLRTWPFLTEALQSFAVTQEKRIQHVLPADVSDSEWDAEDCKKFSKDEVFENKKYNPLSLRLSDRGFENPSQDYSA
jgi:hypothetical protein